MYHHVIRMFGLVLDISFDFGTSAETFDAQADVFTNCASNVHIKMATLPAARVTFFATFNEPAKTTVSERLRQHVV